jgi:MFS family permease
MKEADRMALTLNRTTQAWLVTILLGLFYLINFLDKSVIGLSAVQIMDEMNLTPAEFGLLNSAFFILFVPFQFVGGLLADKYPTSRILLVMALIWSISMVPMIFPAGFAALLASRMVLGAGEGPTAPVAIHALYKWFPNEKRAVPNACYAMGPPAAMALGAPIMVWLIADHGWRFSFLILGGLSLGWAILWLVIGKEGPIDVGGGTHKFDKARWSGYLRVARSHTFLGCLLLGFPSYFGLTIMLAWMPHFLAKAVHLDTTSIGWVIAGAWAIVGIGPLIVSTISQRLMDRGVSARVARGHLSAGLFIFAGIMLLAARILPVSPGVQAAMLIIALPLGIVVNPLLFTLLGQICPVGLRGGVIGIFGSGNTLAGAVAPVAMGFAIQQAVTDLDGYLLGFTCFGVVAVGCGMAAMILIRPEADQQRWETTG